MSAPGTTSSGPVHGFEPISRLDAVVLILGTLPSNESLEAREYYANTNNNFWFMMGEIFDAGWDLTYQARVEVLRQRQVAVWDVLRSAQRAGSMDSKIVRGTEAANTFAPFLQRHPSITSILFNGGKAEAYFKTLVIPTIARLARSFSFSVLPSTSPANTHSTKQVKLTQWCRSLIRPHVARAAPVEE